MIKYTIHGLDFPNVVILNHKRGERLNIFHKPPVTESLRTLMSVITLRMHAKAILDGLRLTNLYSKQQSSVISRAIYVIWSFVDKYESESDDGTYSIMRCCTKPHGVWGWRYQSNVLNIAASVSFKWWIVKCPWLKRRKDDGSILIGSYSFTARYSAANATNSIFL